MNNIIYGGTENNTWPIIISLSNQAIKCNPSSHSSRVKLDKCVHVYVRVDQCGIPGSGVYTITHIYV